MHERFIAALKANGFKGSISSATENGGRITANGTFPDAENGAGQFPGRGKNFFIDINMPEITDEVCAAVIAATTALATAMRGEGVAANG